MPARSRMALVLVVAAAAVSCSATAGARSQRTDRCAGGTTVAWTSKVRVLRTAGRAGSSGGYYACRHATGRKVQLSRRYTRDLVYTLSRFRFAGSLIAYERSAVREGTEQEDRVIVVRSLRTGRQMRRLREGEKRGAAFIEHERRDGVRDIVLTAAGDVAWIVQNPFALAPPQPNVNTTSRTTEVYAASQGRPPVVLDQGPAIAQTSLVKRGCSISWSNGGQGRSARLCI